MQTQSEGHDRLDPTALTGEAPVGTTDAGIANTVTFTDADMSNQGGSGDLGGGRVGGDVGERDLVSGFAGGNAGEESDEEGAEDEAFVTAAVDDGADIAVPDIAVPDIGATDNGTTHSG
ncbi:MAG: hypothetical protein JWN98_818, partial [Abditibacteriota bacterium]|nr:hypothetical protein [Abditibacteriota bacterium]